MGLGSLFHPHTVEMLGFLGWGRARRLTFPATQRQTLVGPEVLGGPRTGPPGPERLWPVQLPSTHLEPHLIPALRNTMEMCVHQSVDDSRKYEAHVDLRPKPMQSSTEKERVRE